MYHPFHVMLYVYNLLVRFSRKDHSKCEFAVYDVFAVDILISTGDGKTKEKDTRTTVYKKTDNIYNLKMKASRGKLLPYICKFLFLNCLQHLTS